MRKQITTLVLMVVLAGCVLPQKSIEPTLPAASTEASGDLTAVPTETTINALPTATQVVRATDLPTETPLPGATPTLAVVGPTDYPNGINPLTGLPVSNPANLRLSPALVSITNWPVEARPQAGLSFSPLVFELYIGEGSSRFLAMFYGDFPNKTTSANDTTAVDDAAVGPIRSGRLFYEPLRQLYHGFLVMASADPGVRANLSGYNIVFGSDAGNINSALIKVSQLEQIAKNSKIQVKPESLGGNVFNRTAPEGGKPAQRLWYAYNLYDQIFWRYNSLDGSYHRWQDNADAKTFIEATDRLNGKPLSFENVVVLFAPFHALSNVKINIDLQYIKHMPALLFRDGKMYEIFWTTESGPFERTSGMFRPIRYTDAQGNPIALKPGQTWVTLMEQFSPFYETGDSEAYLVQTRDKKAGTGNWVVKFTPPEIEAK